MLPYGNVVVLGTLKFSVFGVAVVALKYLKFVYLILTFVPELAIELEISGEVSQNVHEPFEIHIVDQRVDC